MIHIRKIDLLQQKVLCKKTVATSCIKSKDATEVTSLLYYFLFFFAACNVLYNKETIVIGPTPPGTGVIFEAFLYTSSKSTSPMIWPGVGNESNDNERLDRGS